MTSSPAQPPRAAAIGNATGTDFPTWVQRLDDAGARDLDHASIARLLVEHWDVGEWWAQSVTVAYEQQIGRRVVGQSCGGDFSASASRTLDGDMDTVRDRWDRFMTPQRREELGLGKGRATDTATWRYWRSDVTDGTRLSVNVTAKGGRSVTTNGAAGSDAAPRSTLSIEHKGIETAGARDSWKGAWKRTLDEFTAWTKENGTR